MFKKNYIVLLFFSSLYAQSLDQLFTDGNNYFNKNLYSRAIENYNQILDNGFFTQDLYLNLGNAYFEVEDYGNARWSFEMGLKLNPLNEDLNNNNNVNKLFIENYIEVPKDSILDNVNAFYQLLSINQFILVNAILILITSMLFFIYRLFEIQIFKKLFTYSLILSFTFILLTFTKNESVLYSAPYTNESIEISTFYNGNKVKILQFTDSWFEISSFDGRKGWIRAQDIRNLY